MGSRASNSGGEGTRTRGVDLHSDQNDEWETAVAGGYAVLLCLMALRCVVSVVRRAISLFKPHVLLLEGDLDQSVAPTVPVEAEDRPGQTSGRRSLSQDESAPVAGNRSVLGSLTPRSGCSSRTPPEKTEGPRRQPFGTRKRDEGGVRTSVSTSGAPHGVCDPTSTSGDAARLSKMRLERSGPKPDVAPSRPASCPAPLEEETERCVDATTPPSSTAISHGVCDPTLTHGDAARLSNMRLERWGSKPGVALLHPSSYPSPLEEEPEQCVHATTPPSSSTISHGFEHNGWVDVITVALNQMCGEGSWYTSTKELQLASLEFCVACRSFATLNLTVDDDTPLSLLEPEHPPSASKEKRPSSRVPQLRARRVTWNFATAEYLRSPMYALAQATAMEFGEDFVYLQDDKYFSYYEDTPGFGLGSLFHEPTIGVISPLWARLPPSLVKVVFPASLQQLRFGRSFNQPIDRVVWPASLEQLTFGQAFNQPIERVVWPASLQELTLGDCFNSPIKGTKWPTSLRRLEFGCFFNRAVKRVVWPDSLRQLSFGAFFNKPMQGAVLPAFLTHLTLGQYFNRPVEGVTWPNSIRELSFGLNFNQPVEGVTWPNSITNLSFGGKFNQPIAGVTWPAGLQTLSFGVRFNDLWLNNYHFGLLAFDQAIDRARWPTSLRQLSIGGMFKQSLQELGKWMPNLEELRVAPAYAGAYRALLGGIEWPKGLSKLAVAANAVLEEVAVPPTVEIVYMVSQ